jgi:phosphatidate phosphatase APP1
MRGDAVGKDAGTGSDLGRLHALAVAAEDRLDAARHRLRTRLGLDRPRHIAAYRGYGDVRGIELMGRVLADRPHTGPREDDPWWDNLLDTYRRFESDEIPGAPLRLRFRGASVDLLSDAEGYYEARLDVDASPTDSAWENAMVSMADGTLATAQPVLQVAADAKLGVISDIDDTVLHSSITDWKTAAQLAFLHNARTRKPLDGVAQLYQAFQSGIAGDRARPVFYVSSSPWNLYDLLEDFMELNAIPCGPILLRDLGIDRSKLFKSKGHGHKLARTIALIERFPHLRWVLVGDSGQADAELYAEAARSHGARIAAIYIRDVDPDVDSPLDASVDAHIERVAGTSVPMVRARDSAVIAEHAAGLGLVEQVAVAAVARDVHRDRQRPSLAAAAADAALEGSSGDDPVDDR